MLTITIEWHDARKEPPTETGVYLVVKASGRVGELYYSSKHRLFNACDDAPEDEAKEYAIECKYWANKLDLAETESEDE